MSAEQPPTTGESAATDGPAAAAGGPDLGPRTITFPYKRIVRQEPTPAEGPDPYGNPDPEWLEIDWRRHLRQVEIGGAKVNYAEIGDGEPVVFVHGLGGCWQNWLENLPHFAARGYRAIALDLPGFGASPMPDWKISIPAYGRLLDGFVEALGLEPATLVGNSMGGFIAAEVAAGDPAWTQRLVLVSAAGISHAAMRREPAAVTGRMVAAAAPLALRFNELGLRRPGARQMAFGGIMRYPEKIRPELLFEFFIDATGTAGFAPAMASLTGYDILDRLETIELPTLVVWGRDDLVVPASDAAGYVERVREAELHIFEECGHVPMAERPVRFNRVLGEFLERGRR